MAKEFIVYSKTKAEFEALVSSGEVDTSQMGIIAETGEMWWNGEYRLIAETVPFANDLTGRIEATPEEFTFRPSAGDKSIRDESAVIRRIKGNTIVWNQLHSDPKFESSNGGWPNWGGLYCSAKDGELILTSTVENGHATSDKSLASHHTVGHKYFISIDVKLLTSDTLNIGSAHFITYGYSPQLKLSFVDTDWHTVCGVTECIENTWHLLRVDIINHLGGQCSIKNPIYIDLTQVFGAGNEPTTVEEFKALFPNDYYDYNAGELVSMTSNGLFANGFNQFNGEYAEVLPNNTYYLGGTYTTIGFTDEVGGTLEDITIPTDKLYTPTKKGYIYATGTNININLSHTGVRNGEYEPYWDATKDLSIIQKYFPNGMRSAGSICDEISFDESTQKWVAIQRVGSVDLGTLSWTELTTTQENVYRFYSTGLQQKIKKTTSTRDIANLLCVKYDTTYADSTYNANKGVSLNQNGTVLIFEPSITSEDGAVTFKSAMSGVMLYYELAEPIVTPIEEPIDLSYKVGDFGIEKMLSDSFSAPFKADIIYQFNATDRVRENSMNIAKLSKKQILLESEVDALETEVETLNTEIEEIGENYQTIADADAKYLKLTGGTLTGEVSAPSTYIQHYTQENRLLLADENGSYGLDTAFRDKVFGNINAARARLQIFRTQFATEVSPGNYTPTLAFASHDTHGFISIPYARNFTQRAVVVGGGNANAINWHAELLDSENYTTFVSAKGKIDSVKPTSTDGFSIISTIGQFTATETPEAGKAYVGSDANPEVISAPIMAGTTTLQNHQGLRMSFNKTFYTDIATTPNRHFLYTRKVISGVAYPWHRFVEERDDVKWAIDVSKLGGKDAENYLSIDAQTLTANQKAQVAENLGGNTENGLARYVGGVLPLKKISAPDANGVEQTYVLPNASDEDKGSANGVIATEGFVDEGYVPRPSGTSASKANKLLAYSEGRTYDSGVGIAQQTIDIASGATDSVPTSAQVKEYISSIAGPRLAYSENLLGVAVDKEYFDVSNAQKVALSTTAKAILYAAKTLTDVVTVDANGIPTTNRISLADSIIEDNQLRYALPSAPEQSLGDADEVLATERYVQTYMVDNLPKEVATATQRITALPSTNVLPPNVIVDLAMGSLANTISISGLGSGGRDFSYDNVWRLRFAGTSSILSISSSLTIYWENGVAPNFTEWAICDIEFREVPNGSIIGKWTIYR